MIRIFLAASLLLSVLFVAGCSGKDPQINQSAEHWYHQMVRQIAIGNLDMAGDHYTSLSGEHPRSGLIREATMMMAFAHMDRDEHLLANFYFDEYVRRFGTAQDLDRVAFFRLQADYQGIGRAGRDQRLVLDTLSRAEEFVQTHERSPLSHYGATLQAQLLLGRNYMDSEIASLYDRLKKPDAAEHHRQRATNELLEQGELVAPHTGFVRGLFE